MFPLRRGFWAADCDSISIFAGVVEYEKLFHFNACRRGWFDLKVASLYLSVNRIFGRGPLVKHL